MFNSLYSCMRNRMNRFIKDLNSILTLLVKPCVFAISIISISQYSIANADQCKSVFQNNNSPSTAKNIDTITNELVEFYFQSVIDDSAQIVSNDGKENTSKPISNRITINHKISAQNKLMTDLNDLKYLYGESAVNLYYQKIKHRLSQLRKSQKEFEKKKKQKEDEYEKQKKEYEKTQPQYFRENLVFYKIDPGTFMMGEVGNQVETIISQPFEMAATLTTQNIWRKVAELANQSFPDKYQFDINPSTYIGEFLPVESVSFIEVQLWLSALNDLSFAGNKALVDIIPGHKDSDEYRLPTEAEWEFVVRGRGHYNDNYHFGNDVTQLDKYAWYINNSNFITHPVAEKLPLIIDKYKQFFDMHGNVSEMVSDLHLQDISISSGHPTQWVNETFFTIRGGEMNDNAINLKSSYSHKMSINISINYLGFRLVKEVK